MTQCRWAAYFQKTKRPQQYASATQVPGVNHWGNSFSSRHPELRLPPEGGQNRPPTNKAGPPGAGQPSGGKRPVALLP